MVQPLPVLTFTMEHEGPVPLADFGDALARVAARYGRFSRAVGGSDEARLYIAHVREGSIELDLVGAASAAQVVIEGAGGLNNLIELGKNVAGLLQSFRTGQATSAEVSLADCDDVRAIVKPVINTEGGGLSIVVNGDNNVVQPLLILDQQGAREINNRAALLRSSLSTPTLDTVERVLFVWDQIRDAPAVDIGKRSPDRGIIAAVHNKPHPVTFADPAVKDAMYRMDENPFERGFIVDGKIMLGPNGPAGYLITKVHDVIPLDPAAAAA